MQFLTADSMQALDRLAIETHGIPGRVLMQRAGRGVAQAALDLRRGAFESAPFTVLCGRGNNGGDGFVAAHTLHALGHAVDVRLAAEPETLRGDARDAFDAMRTAGVPWRGLPPSCGGKHPAVFNDPLRGILIDALLGTGGHGAPRGTIATAIQWIRTQSQARVLAVDIPSGLDADTGETPGIAVAADLTLTLGAPKAGFRAPGARAFIGRLDVLDIGLPPAPPAWTVPGPMLIAAPALRELLKPRDPDSHKGTFGHVLVVGGSPGMSGAPVLAALGALRGGAGRVSTLTPRAAAVAMAAAAPEVMSHAPNVPDDRLDAARWEDWRPDPFPYSVLVLGPGLGNTAETRRLAERLLREARPMVLDADALNVFAAQPDALRSDPSIARVLTPHPGEAARLLDCPIDDITADPVAAATALARACRSVVVLKGSTTCVSAPEFPVSLNIGGNPGMATAGAGDVLSGVIGALLAQGLSAHDAARTGVYLHATAGDRAAWTLGTRALRARDLVDFLGEAFLSLHPR